jgi:FAD/FMN-containing dehydrogenase
LGGGLGRLQRHWGYSIDNMLAVDLVTADGKQIRASEEENADLFWGMRGAGPNFGIVTAFEFRLHELGQTVTQGVLLFAAERAHQVAARPRVGADGPGRADDVVRVRVGDPRTSVPDGAGRSAGRLHGGNALGRSRRCR